MRSPGFSSAWPWVIDTTPARTVASAATRGRRCAPWSVASVTVPPVHRAGCMRTTAPVGAAPYAIGVAPRHLAARREHELAPARDRRTRARRSSERRRARCASARRRAARRGPSRARSGVATPCGPAANTSSASSGECRSTPRRNCSSVRSRHRRRSSRPIAWFSAANIHQTGRRSATGATTGRVACNPRFERGRFGERDVGPLELPGRGQHVGGERGERVLGDVDDREHVERRQRGAQALPVAETRSAGCRR